jgi:hypothetical protein
MGKLNDSNEREVFAGIYKDKGCPNEEAEFMILYGKQLCLISDGISDIFEDVEVGGLHNVELVEGYALAILRKEHKWQIRNSGRKSYDDYIIAEGTYREGFDKSLNAFRKVLS